MNVVVPRLLLGVAFLLAGVFVFIACSTAPTKPTQTPIARAPAPSPTAGPTAALTNVATPTVEPSATPTLVPTATPTNTVWPTATRTATPVIPNYYVDSVNGSDSNSGRSPDRAWRTLQKVETFQFRPGDIVNFSRGSSWSGGLVLKDSGSEGNPILLRAYGTGPRPSFSNPGQKSVIEITGQWVVVEGLLAQDAVEAGILIQGGAANIVVRDNEVMNVGLGVEILGTHNLVTGNYVHDLHMVVNTSEPKNDDYGAVGFWIQNSKNEVSYNRCVNCRAPSYDYGYDGGVVEIYGNGDDSYIHHNNGAGSQGFLEVGRGSVRNARIAYNISDNNYEAFLCLHTGDRFSATVDNLRIENNTIVKTMKDGGLQLDCMNSSVSPSALLFQNNIVYSSVNVSDQGSFTHTHNIYFMIRGASIGFPLGIGEKLADPLFVSLDKRDYHLLPNSPAIRAGIELGYALDFDGRLMPSRAAPDIGALEFSP